MSWWGLWKRAVEWLTDYSLLWIISVWSFYLQLLSGSLSTLQTLWVAAVGKHRLFSPLSSFLQQLKSFIINHLYIISTPPPFLLITSIESIAINHSMCVWVLPVIIFECSLTINLIICFSPGIQTDSGPWLWCVCVCVCVCVAFRLRLPLHKVKQFQLSIHNFWSPMKPDISCWM